MKLLLYDKFWDNFLELPKGIQKKVLDFQKKFKENPKSSGIHLEKISTFRDQSLRSARIDQTYRAIIKFPENGDTYYLMWVDHHDKAYDWASRKLFQWNNNTQSMQVFTAPDAIDEATTENVITKVESVGLFSSFNNIDLVKIGVPELLIPSIENLKSLDDLEAIMQYLPIEVFENLFYLLDGIDIKNLITEVAEGKSNSDQLDDQVVSFNNQRSFIELTDDDLFNEVLEGGINKWKHYLHPSQRKIVESDFNGAVKVSGAAGTGKTVAALHKLKYLKEQNSKAKILFSTYTGALTENLKVLTKLLSIETNGVTISTIDSLAIDLVKKNELITKGFKVFGREAIKSPEELFDQILDTKLSSFDSSFLIDELIHVVFYNNISTKEQYFRTLRTGRGNALSRRQRVIVWELINEYLELKNKSNFYHREELFNLISNHLDTLDNCLFDHVIVDELQDFSNIELRLIRCLTKEGSNDLFLVGDPLQKIYNKKINFSQAGINIRGKRSKRLRINYRTTEEIKRLAVSIISDCHYDNFDGEDEEKKGYVSLFHGEKPSYQTLKTKKEEIDLVTKELKLLLESGKYNPVDLVITARTNEALKDFIKELHQIDIPYLYYKSGKKMGDANGISILTFHRIKGLEFKHVFMVDVNDRSCPKFPFDFDNYTDQEKEQCLNNEKSLIYVSISRAIERVHISGIGTESKLIQL